MAPRVNTEDLIDSEIVAEILGLSHRNSVTTYLNRYDDMPKPVVVLGRNRVRLWLRQDIETWAKKTGRVQRPKSKPVPLSGRQGPRRAPPRS